MEYYCGGDRVVVVSMMIILMLAKVAVGVLDIYACIGGCFNQCFVRTQDKTQSDKFMCDAQCLADCIPKSNVDAQYYCQIGCSFNRCTPVPNYDGDGALKENCFGSCIDICKAII